MKTPTIPPLLGPDGRTSLREFAGYHGGGSGFGGQLRAWNPLSESVDAALLPNFARGNARADDLFRNNGYAANAIQLHQDHIVGSFSGSVIAPVGSILASGRKRLVLFPARSKRPGKSSPKTTVVALTLSENARLP